MALILLVNGKVETFDEHKERVDAVLIQDGFIVAVGAGDELRLQAGQRLTHQYDLHGAYLLPGLVDSHLHLLSYGHHLSQLDLRQVKTKEELRYALQERAAQRPAGTWIVGSGWDENRFSQRQFITREELDQWIPQHPVLLARSCYHTYLVNQRAYEQAGITADTSDPPGGKLGRDQQGQLNGYVYEHAYRCFQEVIPRPTLAEHRNALRKAIAVAQSQGLVGVHSDDLRELPDWAALSQLYGELLKESPFHVHQLIDSAHFHELKEAGIAFGPLTPTFSVGAVKFFADGSLGGRTAWMSQPYLDRPTEKGLAQYQDEELAQLVEAVVAHNFPAAVHAIGDAAAEQVIDVFAQHSPRRGRHRLVHAQLVRPDLVKRLALLPDLSVDIQPRFVVSDFPWVLEALGEERLRYGYAWRSLFAAGIPCAGGSDAPIEPLDPRLGIHAAVTRRKPHTEEGGYFPEESLSMEAALQLFTQGSAYAAKEEAKKGRIAPGYGADFTLLSHDLLMPSMIVDPDQLLAVRVLGTMVAGQWVYTAGW